jgi:hypothetical protein
MTNDKGKKDIDEYFREMMGTFTEKELKEVARLGLRNLRNKNPGREAQRNWKPGVRSWCSPQSCLSCR